MNHLRVHVTNSRVGSKAKWSGLENGSMVKSMDALAEHLGSFLSTLKVALNHIFPVPWDPKPYSGACP